MKKILFFALFFSLICLSCRKKGKLCRGEASALLNGEIWKPPAVKMEPHIPFSDKYFFIGLGTLDDFGDVEYALNIYKIPYGVGKYYLHRANPTVDDSLTGISLLQYLEVDQLIGGWGVEEEPDSSNYIDISFYDESTGEVEGTFNFTLSGRTIFTYERDTLRFTDGRFEGRICDDD